MRTLKTEVGKGSTGSVFHCGLVGRKVQPSSVKGDLSSSTETESG